MCTQTQRFRYAGGSFIHHSYWFFLFLVNYNKVVRKLVLKWAVSNHSSPGILLLNDLQTSYFCQSADTHTHTPDNRCFPVQEFGVPFMETSAKSGLNVELAFTAVAKWVCDITLKEHRVFELCLSTGTIQQSWWNLCSLWKAVLWPCLNPFYDVCSVSGFICFANEGQV